MPNSGGSLDIPGPIAHLHALADTFRRYDADWSHFRYEEMGGDLVHHTGFPSTLIAAAEELYSEGRDLAQVLADVFGNVTNPDRFVQLSDFVRHVEERIFPRITELERVLADCETEVSALPVFNAEEEAAFAERQAHRHQLVSDLGVVGLQHLEQRSLSHLKRTIRVMIGRFRQQLELLRSAENDVVALKEVFQSSAAPPAVGATKREHVVSQALYRVGEYWEIAFGGRQASLKDSDGLRYIHHLLERPNIVVEVASLRQHGSRQHRPDADDMPIEELDRRLNSSDTGRGRVRRSGPSDPTGLARYTEELDRLEQEIGRAHEARR